MLSTDNVRDKAIKVYNIFMNQSVLTAFSE